MTPNGTYQRPTRSVAAIFALLNLVPGAVAAQSAGNPWNPYHLQAPLAAQTLPPAAPSYAGDVPAQRPQVAPQQPPQTRERFAPPGLEQALSASPFLQVAKPRKQPAPNTGASQYSTPQPPSQPPYAPPAVGGYRQGYHPAPTPGYGGYAPGYGGNGYPAPYGGNGYPGYGSNGPFSPFGFPGGTGGFPPFPGNTTNGGAPGFNLSPFGFF